MSWLYSWLYPIDEKDKNKDNALRPVAPVVKISEFQTYPPQYNISIWGGKPFNAGFAPQVKKLLQNLEIKQPDWLKVGVLYFKESQKHFRDKKLKSFRENK
ncbi:MAG: hypothetical protein Sylvanvirus8_14 [Sylvanvirus sp.]|uniref:Uncharacterized protein n=1 Tax=Sylvanvirus sp. TaxID=2487774 RepID=A0A3G5AHX0_9VIRU|nr:MAG: hypothetical protein Sylvanvirus8_14 [Sylvanvirus sp.]